MSIDKTPLLSQAEIDELNKRFSNASPQQILEWAIANIPRLYQTTAFGLTGLATLDMISQISTDQDSPHLVPLIFINTLYHFPETLELAQQASSKYNAKMHVYTPPAADNVRQFEQTYGKKLWLEDEDIYDYLVKAEPSQRAYTELEAQAVLTGRRRSQGGSRAAIPIFELDTTGLIKINPLATWSFNQVRAYIDENSVPYNTLLDKGYRSVGDWHSTASVDGSKLSALDGDASERAGRWAGAEKSECGLHKDYFKMKAMFNKRKREREFVRRESQNSSKTEEQSSEVSL